EKILEKHYKEKSDEFFHFVESYSTGKSDKELEDMILQLYQFAMSYPWPKEWLIQCKNSYKLTSIQELEQTPWYQNIVDNIMVIVKELMEQLNHLIELAVSTDGPYMYEETLKNEKEMLSNLLHLDSYMDYYTQFKAISFGRLSSKKDETVSGNLRELVKKQRDGIKKTVSSLSERYFYDSPEQILQDMQKCSNSIDVLV
ncbi:hypothetical protein CG709_11525, partial [Lachnotalea glycerini]